jgi:two-component system sensor histidine kinase KdpD
MIYLVAVILSAIYLGRGPSLLAAISGVLAFDVFLIPPYYTFAVSDTQYILTFFVLLTISLVVSTLTARVREQAEAAVQREAQATALYSLGRDLTSATDLEQVAEIIIGHIGEVFGRQVAVFLPKNGQVTTFAHSADYVPDENELAVANWVFQHEQAAGRGTDTLPASVVRCQPLKTVRGMVGVLGVRPSDTGSQLSLEQRQSLLSFADQAALAIERATLGEQAKQAELLSAADKLQTALLNSISHDLRTPLVSITGALSTLEQDDRQVDGSAQRSLVRTAREEADRLNRLVGNLLDMTRLEAGALKIRREPCDAEDLIGTALGQMEDRLHGRNVLVRVEPDTQLVSADFVLIVHVLTNLLDNALKYSTPESPLEVRARPVEKAVEIIVMDRGIGIPKDDLERVFDKFYRVQRPQQVTGTGLGLAICKGIVEAHGGRIWAEERPGGGTCLQMTLPVAEER